MSSDFDDMEPEVADTFAVHALPVGPVTGLPDADTGLEAKQTMAVLRRMGGEAVVLPLSGDAIGSLSDCDEALALWAGEHGAAASRPSALLWFGHGRSVRMGSVLLVPGSKERGNARVTPEMFAHYVHAEQLSRQQDESLWSMVVLEACNSENFAQDVAGKFNGTRQERTRSLLLIATGKPAAQGYLGTFRGLLEAYLETKTSHDRFSLRELQAHFKKHGCFAELVGDETGAEFRLALRDRVPVIGATTVAELRRQQSRYDQAPEAWPRHPTPHHVGFLEVISDFTGRETPLQSIAAWCADDAAAAVLAVTGPPGTGKSALLGEALRRWFHADPEGTEPPPPVVAVLLLTGSTPTDVVRQLAQKLEVTPGGPGHDDPEVEGTTLDAARRRLAELALDSDRHPAAGDEPPRASGGAPAGGTPMRALIVADALDEARDPFRIATLLRELTTIPGVRLLIGTRTTPFVTSWDEGRPADDRGRLDLPEVLGSAFGPARVLPLGPDPSAARDHVAGKIRAILQDHPTGDAAWHDTVTHTVADAVEAHVRAGTWQFLQATLVVQEIEQRPAVLAPGSRDRAALAELMEGDQSGLFKAAVQRITAGLPAAEPLLRALAHAHGRGLPLAEGIWAHAAAGIAGTDGPVDEEQLKLFLSRAAAYVLVDGEDRRSVYRLAHRTFAEQLLRNAVPDRRYAMLCALLELAAAQVESGQALSPHLAHRLAEYAADCGADGWTALAARPAVIDRLPPASLSTLALAPGRSTGTAPTDLPIEVLGTVASAHLIKESASGDRPGLRQLGGLRAAGLSQPAGPGADWEVVWGRLRHVPVHLQLGGSSSPVTALVTHVDAPWLVTGSLDGSVMVWHPWQDHDPGLLRRTCESPVTALAALGSQDRGADEGSPGPGLVAVAHDDRTVHLWDTAADADQPEVRSARCTGMVRVITALPDRSRRFAVGGEGGFLALLGPDGAQSPATVTVSHRDVVGLVPVRGPDGAPLVAAAYQSGELALWAVDGAEPVLVHRSSSRTELAGLAGVPASAESDTLISISEDGRLARWRVHTGNSGPTLLADTEQQLPAARADADPAPTVLAVLPTTGQDGVPVVGDRRGIVRILGPSSAAGAPKLVEASTGIRPIRAISVLRGPQGDCILATAAEHDSTVHFWHPAAVAHGSVTPPAPDPWVSDMRRQALDDGTETLVVTEQRSGLRTVRVLHAVDGSESEVHTASDGSAGEVRRRAVVPDGADDQHAGQVVDCVAIEPPLLLTRPTATRATAGRDGTVVVWQKRSESAWRPIRRIPLGSPCNRLTPLTSGRLAIATDDGVVVLRLDSVAWAVDGGGTEETYV
ncbi:AAA family ATPase [Streptomyces sp. NPDC092307]|uniref:AAA family ATPase n=1 Tax=Streptomyces sp. NPDC092307 TaxID=3366013 RepID=UPI0038102F95